MYNHCCHYLATTLTFTYLIAYIVYNRGAFTHVPYCTTTRPTPIPPLPTTLTTTLPHAEHRQVRDKDQR